MTHSSPTASLCDTCRSPVADSGAPLDAQFEEKTQRAFEHGRQRAKKHGDMQKAKRCVRCRMCKPWKWSGNTGRSDAAPKFKTWDSSTLDDWRVDLAKERSAEHGFWPTSAEDHGAREVSLVDLIKPARKRRGS